MGWPANTGADSDYARFYPATVLETGHDILFFWVARMVMLGLELTGCAPFQTVYLHGLVRDGEGRKMSKSLGNVIDPLDTARQIGSDALRYTLITQAAPGNDLSLSAERLETSRNFVNKLWNAGKYIGNCLMGAEDSESLAADESWTAAEMAELPLPERFVLSRCHEVVAEVTSALETLRFADAGCAVHSFLWDEFADWYLEASKARMRSGNPAVVRSTRRVLVYVWDRCLRLLHPIMPFLTEALWQIAPHRGDSLMIAAWPQREGDDPLHVDHEAVVTFRRLQSLVVGLRGLRSEKNLEPSRKMGLVLRGPDHFCAQIRANLDVFCLLARVDSAAFRSVESGETLSELCAAAGSHLHVIVDDAVDAFVPQAGLVDTAKEAARLGKQRDKLQKEVASAEARVSSAAFVQRAPPALVKEALSTLAELRDKLTAVDVSIARLTARKVDRQ